MRAMRFTAACAAVVLCLGGEALADPRVDIAWTTTGAGPVNGNWVEAEVGDFVTATLLLENVGGSIAGYSVSFTYDTTELLLVSATEFLPTGFEYNFSSGVATSSPDAVGGYEAVNIMLPAVSGQIVIGEAVFEVVSVIRDTSADIVTGIHSTEDAIYDGNGYGIIGLTLYGSGFIGASPEVPALGTFGLALFGSLLAALVVGFLRRTRNPSGVRETSSADC